MTRPVAAPEATGPGEGRAGVPEAASRSRPPASSKRWFRGDIDGLRAIAVLLVVVFHAQVPGFDGGFIGVDVFFVISGYLITRNIVAEVDRTDRVDLLGFWGRRIRRLVPALALMLVVVLALATRIRGVLDWNAAATQARAAALYVSNIYFARQPTGYFGVDLSSSLFLHTWSLGVEEQFYVLWPLLFLGLGFVTRGRARRRHGLLRGVLLAVLAGSLLISVLLTRGGSSTAFFGLASRAWEFAIAGLLALVTVPAWLRRPASQVALVVVGGGMILAAAVVLSSTDPYPGVRALLPVVGALLVLAGGEQLVGGGTNPLSRLLAISPAQWLGRLSYSWYLWHWPLILLAVDVLGRNTTKVRLAGALVSLGVAAGAHYLVENPIRFGPRIVASRRLTYGGAALVTLGTLAMTFGVAAGAQRLIGRDPVLSAVEAARKDRAQDMPCAATGRSREGLEYCIDGDLEGDRTVVLFGDSHAGQWRLAFSAAAKDKRMRLITIWHPACPPIQVQVLGPYSTPQQCANFQHAGVDAILELHPALVVVSNTANYEAGVVVPAGIPRLDGLQHVWSAAYASLVKGFESRGIAVAGMIDNPGSHAQDPLDCLVEKKAGFACRLPRSAALLGPHIRAAEAAVQARLKVPTFDATAGLCNAQTCGFTFDGTHPVLSDAAHLNVTYTMRHVADLERLIDEGLGEKAR